MVHGKRYYNLYKCQKCIRKCDENTVVTPTVDKRESNAQETVTKILLWNQVMMKN